MRTLHAASIFSLSSYLCRQTLFQYSNITIQLLLCSGWIIKFYSIPDTVSSFPFTYTFRITTAAELLILPVDVAWVETACRLKKKKKNVFYTCFNFLQGQTVSMAPAGSLALIEHRPWCMLILNRSYMHV